MKKITHLLLLALTLFSLNTFAKTIDSFDSDPSARVMDYTQTQVLSDFEKKNLTIHLENLKGTSKNVEGFIVLVDSTDGVNINEYTNSLFRKWKIGNKDTNNGLLLVIAKNDRKYRTEVGYGLEGIFNDGFLGTAMRDSFKPNFKNNKFYNGINDYLSKLEVKIEKSITPLEASANITEDIDPSRLLIVLGVILVIGIPTFFIIRRNIKKNELLRIEEADRAAMVYRASLDKEIARRHREELLSTLAAGSLAAAASNYTPRKSTSSSSSKKSSTKSKSSDSSDSSYDSFSSSDSYSSSSSSSSSSFDSGGDSGGGGSSGDW